MRKDITKMPLGEALMYVRKSHKEYSSRDKLSQVTGVSKWMLTRYEREGYTELLAKKPSRPFSN